MCSSYIALKYNFDCYELKVLQTEVLILPEVFQSLSNGSVIGFH